MKMSEKRKAKAKKSLSKDDRVMTVKRALRKFVAWDDLKPIAVQRAIRTKTFRHKTDVFYRSIVVLDLGDGKFAIPSESYSIRGTLGGFNNNGLPAAWGLWKLGILTKADFIVFQNWWNDQVEEFYRKDDLKKAQVLVEKHGYRIEQKRTT